MSFFDRLGATATPDGLREAIRSNLGAQADADQLVAEVDEARRLAPPENDFLRDELATVVHRALVSMDESHDFEGTAPVLVASPFGYSPSSTERTRRGSAPVIRGAVCACHGCGQSRAGSVPFWLALGRHILQIDLCGSCSVGAIDRGAKPQGLSIPDAVPEDFA